LVEEDPVIADAKAEFITRRAQLLHIAGTESQIIIDSV